MRSMMQKTLVAAGIAVVCGALLLMPGTVQAGEVSGPESGGPIYDCYEDGHCLTGYKCLYGYCVSSKDICQLNYSAFWDAGTMETGEQSKTYTAAAEFLLTKLLEGDVPDPSCGLQTRGSILEECTDGCCTATCDPVTLKACIDGTAYYSLFCQQEPVLIRIPAHGMSCVLHLNA